jgi:hypothetical protein
MKKIGDYDPFFVFLIFSSKRWLATKKKSQFQKWWHSSSGKIS